MSPTSLTAHLPAGRSSSSCPSSSLHSRALKAQDRDLTDLLVMHQGKAENSSNVTDGMKVTGPQERNKPLNSFLSSKIPLHPLTGSYNIF